MNEYKCFFPFVITLLSSIEKKMSTLQRNVPKSKYMNKAMRLQIYKKYNWQHASAKLATVYMYSHIEGCWMGPRPLLHAIILAFGGFNPKGQTAKLIPRQILRLYSITQNELIGSGLQDKCTISNFPLTLNASHISIS